MASFCVQLWTVKPWALMHMHMTVEIFIAIMVVKRSDREIEIERSSSTVYVGWAWSGFFVVVVVHTPTDYIEGLFRVVSQFNITARILNVLHANKEICLIL